MTEPGHLGICQIDCEDCPLNGDNNRKRVSCRELEYFHAEEAIAIMQKWSEGHPRKTILQDFLEKYPKAPMDEKGFPLGTCPHDLGLEEESCEEMFDDRCFDCWNRPLEEVRKDDTKK